MMLKHAPSPRRNLLPLGLDVRADFVAVVLAEACGSEFRATRAAAAPVPETSSLAISGLFDALRQEHTIGRTRPAVVSALPVNFVRASSMELHANIPVEHRVNAAQIHADEYAGIERAARIVRVETSEQRGTRGTANAVFAVRRDERDAHLAMLREGGVDVVALDVPAAAWLRIAPYGVLDDDATNPFLAVPILGVPQVSKLPPDVSIEVFANSLVNSVTERRKNSGDIVDRLAYFGLRQDRFAFLRTRLKTIGLTLSPIRIGRALCPPWAFAYALATWSIA